MRFQDFTVITPTGDRPEAFALCRKYFNRQTIKPKEWIVVDDGKKPMPIGDEYKLIRREPTPQDKFHTLRVNLKLALENATTQAYVIMEDDDWYHPEYLRYMFNNLQEYDLFGQGHAIYYNVVNRTWKDNNNTINASLCQTGFTHIVVPFLKPLYGHESGTIDWDIWTSYAGKKHVDISAPVNYCIGIKAMPGRTGTHGHGWEMENKDPELKNLKQFICDDYASYECFKI